MEPEAEVIIPCYNAERFLEACLSSVLCQQGVRFVIRVADDHSTDGSWGLLQQWAERDSRIVVERPFGSHVGYIVLLNSLIRSAHAPVLIRQDADDYSLPGRFSAQLTFLRDHPSCALIGSQVRNVTDDGVHFVYPWEQEFVNPIASATRRINHVVRQRHVVVHGSIAYRTKQVRDVGLYDPRLEPIEDWDLCLKLASIGDIFVLPAIHYVRRVHPSGISRRHTNKEWALDEICRRHRIDEYEHITFQGGGHVPGHPEL